MLHDGVPSEFSDPIQAQRHRGPKVVKMAIINVYLLRQYVCNQKTNDEF